MWGRPVDPPEETFHAKIVLADGVAAYVGSANLLRRSKVTNLECGMLIEGEAGSGRGHRQDGCRCLG
ncbi:phospholipase D-like domain-containing protein [Pacificispira sp.]|uniref:phospholipase D-like domain-containing protein n=1 Tax=Pacificispira sp. TaxID=2888761 RepID=UPI003B52D528